MELWSIGMLHLIGSLFYTDTSVVESITLDTSSIQVSSTIEHIFKAHCFSLAYAASAYERKHYPTAFTQLHKDMYQKQLVQLLQENQPQIKEVCETDEVEQAFKQAYQKTKTNIKTNERLVYWTRFIHRLYEKQATIRKEKLSGIWFPTQQDESNEKEFIERNAELELNETQRNCFIATKIVTFLPFVLIEQYDKEAFKAFLEAREET